MNRLNKRFLTFGFILALLGIVPIASYGQSSNANEKDKDKTENVNVVNTPNVKVVNTAGVNVVNTPNVNVANTANVNVLNTVGVKIENDLANPALIRSVDEPSRQPFQLEIDFDTNGLGANINQITLGTVPAGKRLVIEHVSVDASVPVGQNLLSALKIFSGGKSAVHPLITLKQGIDVSNQQRFVTSQQVRLYADAGSILILRLERDTVLGGEGLLRVANVSGYLVDLP